MDNSIWWGARILVEGVCHPLFLFEYLFTGPPDAWRMRTAVILTLAIPTVISAAAGVYCRKAWCALVVGAIAPILLAFPMMIAYWKAVPFVDPQMIHGQMAMAIFPFVAASSFWITGGIAWGFAKLALPPSSSTGSQGEPT